MILSNDDEVGLNIERKCSKLVSFIERRETTYSRTTRLGPACEFKPAVRESRSIAQIVLT